MRESERKRFFKINERRERHGKSALSRREFIRLSTMAAAAAGVPALQACGGGESDIMMGDPAGTNEGLGGAGGSPAAGGAPSGGGSPASEPPIVPGVSGADGVPVGMVRNADIEFMVREAIERAGGLSSIVGGDRVVIKPNTVSNLGIGGVRVTTHPQVLAAVIDAVRVHTDSTNITVADNSGMGALTLPVAQDVGFTAVTEARGIPFTDWASLGYALYLDPDWTAMTEAKLVPEMLDPANPQYDHFINVPMLKNHEQLPDTNVDFTCCLKNFVGLIKWDGPNSRIGTEDIHSADLGTKVAEMGRFVPTITMNVIDAISLVLTNGPAGWRNLTRDITVQIEPHEMDLAPEAGLVIASADRVAADSVAFATLKHYAQAHGIDRPYVTRPVAEQAQLKRARELGLGTHLLEEIAIFDDNVGELDAILAQWG